MYRATPNSIVGIEASCIHYPRHLKSALFILTNYPQMSADGVADDGAPPAKRVRLENTVVPLKQRLAEADATSSAEELVGISGYINPDLPAFTDAIIKHRFTDFLVWEINQNGQVVRLKDIARPLPAAKSEPSNDRDSPTKEHGEAKELSLSDLVSEQQLREIEDLAADGSSKGSITLEVRDHR